MLDSLTLTMVWADTDSGLILILALKQVVEQSKLCSGCSVHRTPCPFRLRILLYNA